MRNFFKIFRKFFAILLFLGESNIFLKDKFDLQIPETTDEVIFPVPIKPSFINVFSTLNY